MIGQVPETARLELKFCTASSDEGTVWRWLHFHPAGFRKAFPDRWVNNIYFDTHDYGAYQDNLSGTPFRAKVRYRWYGDSIAPISGDLEVKYKRNTFGWKVRYPIKRPPDDPSDGCRAFLNGLLAQLPDDGRWYLKENALPVLQNRYHRQYLVTWDGHFRATIDTRQSAWDLRGRPSVSKASRIDLRENLVLELKFDRSLRDQAARLLSDVPIRVSRNSKYIIGAQAAGSF